MCFICYVPACHCVGVGGGYWPWVFTRSYFLWMLLAMGLSAWDIFSMGSWPGNYWLGDIVRGLLTGSFYPRTNRKLEESPVARCVQT